jgi:hypothetical protein
MLSIVAIVIGLGVGRTKNRGSIPGTGTKFLSTKTDLGPARLRNVTLSAEG